MTCICVHITAKRVWVFQTHLSSESSENSRDPITEHLRVFCFVAIKLKGTLIKMS